MGLLRRQRPHASPGGFARLRCSRPLLHVRRRLSPLVCVAGAAAFAEWQRASLPPAAAAPASMRPLTEEETKAVFEKLYKYVGKSIKTLVARPDEPHCLRLQKNRVFYVRDSLVRRATNVAREKLQALGTQVGRFTHSGKFHLTVGALDVLAQY